jgi:hypothetical protein
MMTVGIDEWGKKKGRERPDLTLFDGQVIGRQGV